MTINAQAPYNKNRCNLGAGAYQLEPDTGIVYETAGVGRVEMQGIGSKLNWSRMLGFEQVTDQRSTRREGARLGAKIGGKGGLKG